MWKVTILSASLVYLSFPVSFQGFFSNINSDEMFNIAKIKLSYLQLIQKPVEPGNLNIFVIPENIIAN